MPRREWSRPFPEVKALIMGTLIDGRERSSDEIVAETGLPFEDVISALRMLRHNGELEFEPEWAAENELRAARRVRVAAPPVEPQA